MTKPARLRFDRVAPPHHLIWVRSGEAFPIWGSAYGQVKAEMNVLYPLRLKTAIRLRDVFRVVWRIEEAGLHREALRTHK